MFFFERKEKHDILIYRIGEVNMKEKGFSLIELLAVIVILSIAALISVPLITGIINDSKLNGLKDSAYGILKSANLYFSQYEPETNIRFDIEENQVTSKDAEEMIQYKGYVKEGAVIVNATGKITMCITDGTNSVYKNYKDKSIVVVENDSCYIPENQAIVYLANGGATLDELDNQELTDLVTSLQEEINSLKTAKEAQSNLITTLQAKIDSLETGLSSKANQSDLNTTNSNISSMSTQIETIGTIANAAATKTEVSSLNSTVSNHTTNLSTINNELTVSTKSYTVPTYGGTIVFKRYGNIVTVHGYGIGSTKNLTAGASYTLVNNIDSKYRPSIGLVSVGFVSGNWDYSSHTGYQISSDGNLSVYAYQKIGSGHFTFTYVVG